MQVAHARRGSIQRCPLFHRTDRNAMASTTSHPVMTSAATAPDGYFSFRFRRVDANIATSLSPDRRKSRKSIPRYLQVSDTLRSVTYSSTPFLVDNPEITSR